MKPKAVIFDIGNVLIEWNPERFYDAAIGQARREAMFDAVDLHGMNNRVDLGENFREVVYATASKFPEWRREIEMWHDCWLEMASPVIAGSVHLMERLQARGVPVFSLTNFGIQTYDLAANVYPFLRCFDRDFISGHMGTVKPDQQIYRMLEESCGLPPAGLLFTDDRPENIATAAARGWQTHLFEGPDGWAERLVATGLLAADDAA